MVCVDSKLSRGSSSFFTSRGAGAGALATTTCCNDVSLFAPGLLSAARNFGQDLRAGATDCVRTGAVFTAGVGAALLGAAGFGGGGIVCFGGGANAFFGGGAIAGFAGGAVSGCGANLTGVAAAVLSAAGALSGRGANLTGVAITAAIAGAAAAGAAAAGGAGGGVLTLGATVSVRIGVAMLAGICAVFFSGGLLGVTTSVRTGAMLAMENGGAIFNSKGIGAGRGVAAAFATGASGASACF